MPKYAHNSIKYAHNSVEHRLLYAGVCLVLDHHTLAHKMYTICIYRVTGGTLTRYAEMCEREAGRERKGGGGEEGKGEKESGSRGEGERERRERETERGKR